MDCLERSSSTTCFCTWQEAHLKKGGKLAGLPLLMTEEAVSFSCLLFLVINTALERAISFSTLEVRENWNFLQKVVSFAAVKPFMPCLLYDRSMASKILNFQVPEISYEAFPTTRSVCCTRANTSVPGTTICGYSPCPPSMLS